MTPVPPRLCLAGNQWISEHLVGWLVEAGYPPHLLLNLAPERGQGISGYADLAPLAERHRIALYRPASYALTALEDEAVLADAGIDVLIVFGWQRLIPAWLIERCRLGVYGVHGGPEPPPRCRGRAVFNWALILGCTRFHLYLFRITPEADAGDILDTVEFEVTPHDDIVSLYHKNCVVTERMLMRQLPRILDGTARGRAQPASGATWLPRRRPENGGIRWGAPAARISDLVRALAPPYPGAFTTLDGSTVRVLDAHPFDAQLLFAQTPGTVIEVFPNGHLLVAASDQAVYVRRWEAPPGTAVRRGVVFAETSGVQLPDPTY